MSTKEVIAQIAVLAIVTQSSTVAMAAQENPLPPAIQAERSLLHDQLNGVALYEADQYASTTRTYPGSVGKLMTLHLALWAERNGYVHMNDLVFMTDRSVEQKCTCMIDMDGNDLPDVVFGEQFRFEDLLYFISNSAGEATDAVAEHVAKGLGYVPPAGSTPYEASEYRLRYFISQMNWMAGLMGLHDTFYPSVHGGDWCDLSVGCDDAYGGTCEKGELCDGGGTTPWDLVKLWNTAAGEDPRFVQILGERDWQDVISNMNNIYPHTKDMDWYYSGVLGDKNGGTKYCQTCFVSEAQRLNRSLLGVIMQSPDSGPDVGALLRYGFARLFSPILTAASPSQYVGAPTSDHAVACFGEGHVATVEITPSSGVLILRRYAVSVGAGTIHETQAVAVPAYGNLQGVDVAMLDEHQAVVAARDANSLYVMKFEIEVPPTAQGPEWVLKEIEMVPAQGGTVEIVQASADMVVTAVDIPGAARLDSWRVNGFGASDPLTHLAHKISGYASSLSLAVGDSWWYPNRQLVLAYLAEDLRMHLANFDIDPDTGAMTLMVDMSASTPWRQDARVTTVAPEIYATNSGDFDGRIKIDFWKIPGDGSLVQTDWSAPGAYSDQSAIAPIGDTGVVTIQSDQGNVRVHVWDSPFIPSEGDKDDRLLAHSGNIAGEGLAPEICRLDSTAATGDYLVAVRSPRTGSLMLTPWRVGSNVTPPEW